MGFLLPAAGLLSAGLSAFGRQNPEFNYQDSAAANQYNSGATQAFGQLQNTINNGSYKSYQNMLGEYSQTGGAASQGDISRANQFTQSIFAPQQTQLNQAFQQQLYGANQQAALSGRDVNDPLLRAKLAQEQTRQQQTLGAQQTAFSAQQANQYSQDRLGYAGQAAQNDLSTYGNLFNTAQQGLQSERSFGMQKAQGEFMQQANSTSFAQRLGATLQGGIAGAGAGLQAGGLSSLFGGGGGTSPGPGGFSMPSFGGSASSGGGGFNLGGFGQSGAANPFSGANPYSTPKQFNLGAPSRQQPGGLTSSGLTYEY